jgi:hypothetical protein
MGPTSSQPNDADTVFIAPDDPNYSTATTRLAGAFKQKRVVPFLGAGISTADVVNQTCFNQWGWSEIWRWCLMQADRPPGQKALPM